MNDAKEIIENQNIILQNINKSFTSPNYDTSNLDNGEEEVIIYDNVKTTLTTTENQKNNNANNTIIIDLSECEEVLRNIYNISNDKRIYIIREMKQI